MIGVLAKMNTEIFTVVISVMGDPEFNYDKKEYDKKHVSDMLKIEKNIIAYFQKHIDRIYAYSLNDEWDDESFISCFKTPESLSFIQTITKDNTIVIPKDILYSGVQDKEISVIIDLHDGDYDSYVNSI